MFPAGTVVETFTPLECPTGFVHGDERARLPAALFPPRTAVVFHVEPRLPLVTTTDKHLTDIVNINRSEERTTLAFQAVDVARRPIGVIWTH